MTQLLSSLTILSLVCASVTLYPESTQAAGFRVELITSGTSWVVPAGVTSVKAEVIGPGGSGAASNLTGTGGGSGGSYSAKFAIPVTPGASVTYQVGLGGTGNTTWFSSTGTVLANAGTNGTTTSGGATPGAAVGVGDVVFKGGDVGASISGGKPGGGGAAGPNGAGGNAAGVPVGSSGTGGGGANGGGNSPTSSSGTRGGHNRFGVGGGAAGTNTTATQPGTAGGGGGGGQNGATLGVTATSGAAGSMDLIWTDTVTLVQVGPGAGGGGSTSNTNSIGGSNGGYGAGGGGGRISARVGGDGLIVLTYTPQPAAAALSPSKFFIYGGLFRIIGGSFIIR